MGHPQVQSGAKLGGLNLDCCAIGNSHLVLLNWLIKVGMALVCAALSVG